MVFVIYNLLFPLMLVAMLPYFLFRMCRRGGYARGFLQRFGWYGAELQDRIKAKPRIWIHAVSVGETFVALKVMEEWRRVRPGVGFVMTVNTSTAHALASKSLPPSDVLLYFPLDFAPVMRRVLQRIGPCMLVLTESEFWPCLIHLCHTRKTPVILVNGRMSDRSFKGYCRFRALFAPVLRILDKLCVQGDLDRERFIRVGANAPSVVATGSAKYDVALENPGDPAKAMSILASAGFSASDLILLGGSTWPGEEEILLDYFIEARGRIPRLKLVLVPRHAERRGEVITAMTRRSLPFAQRSKVESGTVPPVDILLVDTTGELRHLYTMASAIFIGKSLTQHGGQNLIEPAACGKAVVVGPNMENFREITREFLATDAVIQVEGRQELAKALDRLLLEPDYRRGYGSRALALVDRNRGSIQATVRIAEAIIAAKPMLDGEKGAE